MAFGDQSDRFYNHPRLARVARVEVPEAGGWIYQFSSFYGVTGYEFVPNLEMWAAAMAEAIGQPPPPPQPASSISVTLGKPEPKPKP